MMKEEAITIIEELIHNNFLSIGEPKFFESERKALCIALNALKKEESANEGRMNKNEK